MSRCCGGVCVTEVSIIELSVRKDSSSTIIKLIITSVLLEKVWLAHIWDLPGVKQLLQVFFFKKELLLTIIFTLSVGVIFHNSLQWLILCNRS